MSAFEPIKALKEEIVGLVEVRTALAHRERQLAIRHGEVEAELNAVNKLKGFADTELERKRQVLKGLES